MKKMFLFTTLLFISHVLLAQHTAFGLKAGANLSNIWVKGGTTDYITGFHLGALAHIHLAPKWALQPELLYSQQGGRQTISGAKTTTHLDYVNIPILFQRMFGSGFRLEAGPQIGFLANAKNKTSSSEADVKSRYKSIDFSFPLGLGYLTSSGLGFDARWVPGISDIQETGISTANNAFQLGLFYQFASK